MKRARFLVFGLFLIGCVTAAVSTLVAQTSGRLATEFGDMEIWRNGDVPLTTEFGDMEIWRDGDVPLTTEFGDMEIWRDGDTPHQISKSPNLHISKFNLQELDGRGAQLGVSVSDLQAEELKGTANAGVRVDEVDEDSPAAKAGIREGDIVVEYDGERVRSSRQFARLVQESPDGRAVKLGLLRDGKKQTLDVTPESRAFGWGVDGDRIGREIARSMRELEPRLRELEPRMREIEPRMREFRFDAPGFKFEFPEMMTPRGRLGIQIDELNPQLAQYFGARDGGILVSSVNENSAAQKAGLKAGDVITSINGAAVRNFDDLREKLRDVSGEVTIGIIRDKKESTVKATVEDARARTRRPGRPI